MGCLIDETGKRYWRLLVIARAPNSNRGAARWVCRCDCGTEKTVQGDNLRNGNVTSCGCRSIEVATTHGQTESGAYASYQNMLMRCYNANSNRYESHGGRGITVCARWLAGFENFFADMGHRPAGRSLDRIDNEGHYEPGNCRWATSVQQANNRRPRRWWKRPLNFVEEKANLCSANS